MNGQLHRRRDILFGASGLLLAACSDRDTVVSNPTAAVEQASILEIERRVGGRVGVFALDTGSGRTLEHRADERFAMCSTFKWVLAAAVLHRVDRGQLSLDEQVPFQAADLLEHAPVAREHLASGVLSIETLAKAVVTVSDNTAANLLLGKIDGPEGMTRFIRAEGDDVTRLDRIEPMMSTNEPDDPRDTTSPRAMVGLMQRILYGDVLAPRSHARLKGWMIACETGTDRLRAGFPENWVVGDKTGSGGRNAINDVAFAEPPGRPPILVAAYLSEGHASKEDLKAAHAEVARVVTQGFAIKS
jgi:beta-lactamase class A